MPLDHRNRASRLLVFLLLVAGSPPLALAAAALGGNPAEPLPEDAPPQASSGRSNRIPWTTSRFAGTPDPAPPYRVEPAFPALKFDSPVVVAAASGLDRLFVAELNGKIYSFPNRPDCPRADLAIDLPAVLPAVANVFGMAFHPNFARNHLVYLCYTLKGGGPAGTRVASFRVDGTNPPSIQRETETVLLTWQAGGHNAGCLAFGADGYLYIGAGDTADPTPPDPLGTGQMISDIPSSILRIDVDHPEGGKTYRIPPDNPFITAAGARPEVWAFGFRNPWRFSFDRKTGNLWVGDVGWELWEMIHLVKRGGNYGWSLMEGPQPVRPDGPRGPGPVIPPVIAHPHSEAGSITGGYVYRGRQLPALVGVYVYGDFQSGKVWGLRHDGEQVTWKGVLADTPLQLVSFGEDNDGEVYAIDFQRSQQLYKFVPNPSADTAATFPRTLGQTGLFADTKALTPAPGVAPYVINAELWADQAHADRWLAVPGTAQVVATPAGSWQAPEGTVLARTITLEMERGNPKTKRRLETQILHQEEGTWRPYTYLWNDEQTDATLVDAEGATRTLKVKDTRAPGGERVQVYRTFARSECVLCHNPWVERQTTIFGRQSASPLAFHTAQMNRTTKSGGSKDQLKTLRNLGLIDGPAFGNGAPLPKLADPYDRQADLDARARSYLGVNCSHCHQFGAGGSANIFLQATAPLAKTNTLGARPMQGGFGISDAQIIAPGDPAGSVLYYRMAKLGGGRMPRVGSNAVDEVGLGLIHDWIAGLPHDTALANRPEAKEIHAALTGLESRTRSSPKPGGADLQRLIASPRGALALMRSVGQGRLDRSVAQEVVAEVMKSPSAEVKDLFERFLPEADRIRRLGDAFAPADILTLRGNRGRGEQLFAASSTQCVSCHRVGAVGKALGPDLDGIGAKYDRPTLLRHILEPSLLIEPKFVVQTVETKSGVITAGMLVERTPREVVLKDARNETIRVAADDIETVTPQGKSLMPELLLRDLTAQQAADLLDYLGSLKAPAR